MWKPKSKHNSSSLKQVLNMIRFAEAFHLSSECECTNLEVGSGRPKPVLLCRSIRFLPQIANIYSLKRNCLTTGRAAKLTYMS